MPLRAAAQVRFVGQFSSCSEGPCSPFKCRDWAKRPPTHLEQATFWDEGLREDATAFDLLGDALGIFGRSEVDSPTSTSLSCAVCPPTEVNDARGKPHLTPEKPGVTHRPWIAPRSVWPKDWSLATPPARRVRIAGTPRFDGVPAKVC